MVVYLDMKTKEIDMETINKASEYYLRYQGLPATKKRIEKLKSQMTESAILKLATERGFILK